MSNDREQSHDPVATNAAAPDRVDADPGRGSHSALMRKPNHAVPSGLLSRKARDANGVAEGADTAVATASSSSGSALPDNLQRKFESSLGADLSGVRLHTGDASAAANDAVGAKAYTMGNDIHFGAGNYDPSSKGGEHLLAHEVAHTVQQSGGAQRRQFKLAVSSPGDAMEHEADRAADAMISGSQASVTTATGVARQVYRKPDEPSVTVGKVEGVTEMAGAARVKLLHSQVVTTQNQLTSVQKTAGDKLIAAYALQQQIVDRHVKQLEVELEALKERYSSFTEVAKLAHETAEFKEHSKHEAELCLKKGLIGVDLLAHAAGCGPLAGLVVYCVDVLVSETIINPLTKAPAPPDPPPLPIPKLTFLGEDLAVSGQMAKALHALTSLGGPAGKLTGAANGLFDVYGWINKKSASADNKATGDLAKKLASLESITPYLAGIQNELDNLLTGAEDVLTKTRASLAADLKINNTKTKAKRASELVGQMVDAAGISEWDPETQLMSGTVRASTGELFKASFSKFFKLTGPKYVPEFPHGPYEVRSAYKEEVSITNPIKLNNEPDSYGKYDDSK